MAFQQLGWFPVETTETINNPVQPILVNGRYLYPGDTFVDPEQEVAHYITATGVGPVNQGVACCAIGDAHSTLKTESDMKRLLEKTESHQRCLAYGSYSLPDAAESIHFYLSSTDHPADEPAQFPAWWKISPRDSVAVSPTDSRNNSVTERSFPRLRSQLREHPPGEETGYLRELVASYPELNDLIDDLIETAEKTVEQRPALTKGPQGPDPAELHKPTDAVPKVKDSDGIWLDESKSIYPADRFLVNQDTEDGITGCNAVSGEEALQSTEQLIVLDLDTESAVDLATLHYFYDDREEDFSVPELRNLLATVNNEGGFHFRCLTRDGYVRVIGADSPAVYSFHAYHVRSTIPGNGETYCLLAYEKHDQKEVLLEHPLALKTQKFDNVDEMARALRNPKDHEQALGSELARWSQTDENVREMCSRAAMMIEDTGEQRGLYQPTAC